MVEKLTVLFFVFICLMAGVFLILAPWVTLGTVGDWGDNFFLTFVVQKTGMPVLQQIVSSTWARGAVSGFGVLNLFVAFWEVAHFEHAVQQLSGQSQK